MRKLTSNKRPTLIRFLYAYLYEYCTGFILDHNSESTFLYSREQIWKFLQQYCEVLCVKRLLQSTQHTIIHFTSLVMQVGVGIFLCNLVILC